MKESRWLRGTNPLPMLDLVQGRVSDRKLWLFAAACCRHIEHLITDPRKRRAVDILERFADGEASADELREVPGLFDPDEAEPASVAVAHAALSLSVPHLPADAARDAIFASHYAAKAYGKAVVPGWDSANESITGGSGPVGIGAREARSAEYAAQCQLLRDIVGNPFQPADFNPPWRAAAGTAARLAAAIDRDRRFAELPELAQALAAAGCDDPAVLDHCREPGPHVRGCWVVDLVLGKA